MSLPLPTLLSALAALAAVLGLVLLVARGARRIGLAAPATGRRLALQESLALDRARRLHVVRCDGRDLLLVTGGTADVVVGWLPSAIAGEPA